MSDHLPPDLRVRTLLALLRDVRPCVAGTLETLVPRSPEWRHLAGTLGRIDTELKHGAPAPEPEPFEGSVYG